MPHSNSRSCQCYGNWIDNKVKIRSFKTKYFKMFNNPTPESYFFCVSVCYLLVCWCVGVLFVGVLCADLLFGVVSVDRYSFMFWRKKINFAHYNFPGLWQNVRHIKGVSFSWDFDVLVFFLLVPSSAHGFFVWDFADNEFILFCLKVEHGALQVQCWPPKIISELRLF